MSSNWAGAGFGTRPDNIKPVAPDNLAKRATDNVPTKGLGGMMATSKGVRERPQALNSVLGGNKNMNDIAAKKAATGVGSREDAIRRMREKMG